MVKKKHKEYKLDDLHEGDVNMITPGVIPDKDKYSAEEELGLDVDRQGKKHWTIDPYAKKTPPVKETKMKNSELKKIIKECIREAISEKDFKSISIPLSKGHDETDVEGILTKIYGKDTYESSSEHNGRFYKYKGKEAIFTNVLAVADVNDLTWTIHIHTPEAKANWDKIK